MTDKTKDLAIFDRTAIAVLICEADVMTTKWDQKEATDTDVKMFIGTTLGVLAGLWATHPMTDGANMGEAIADAHQWLANHPDDAGAIGTTIGKQVT